MKFAVIKTGGKQYFVREGEDILIDNLGVEAGAQISFETLASGDIEKMTINLGKPTLAESVKGKVSENLKGDKVRVARFKAKSRYRKVRGFRAQLSKVKIVFI